MADGQQDKRRLEFFTDQHGREYSANIEIKTGHPCEVIRPMGWKAPSEPSWYKGQLTPPENVRTVLTGRQRAKRGHSVEIDYDKWLAMWDEAFERYQQKLHDFARGMTNGSGNLIEMVNNPPPVLREIVGPPPSPPREFIVAAQNGDAWALGQSDVIPRKAVEILERIKPLVTRNSHGMTGNPLADDDEDESRYASVAVARAIGEAQIDDALEAAVQPKRRK